MKHRLLALLLAACTLLCLVLTSCSKSTDSNQNNSVQAARRSASFLWQGQKDLNSRHAVLETAALPTELYPYMGGLRGLEPRTNRL